jgi:DNA-binding CsgD family transcriptional regulator
MSKQISERFRGLTEKEKLTLRLMVRGHDAKSIARSLGLSVHTVNERLRDARRKMEVSSSREAARLLFEAEAAAAAPLAPDLLGDREIGEDASHGRVDQGAAPIGGVGREGRPWFIIGGFVMISVLGLLAAATLSPTLSQLPSTPPPTRVAAQEENSEVAALARQWLELLDQGRWDESYQGTGSAFQKLNSVQVWADVSEQVRTPLGAAVSRTFLSQQTLPAPPAGYEVVKFRTRFANAAEPTVETVSLEREGGSWHVVGVIIG